MTGRGLHKEWIGRTARSAVPDKVIHRLIDRCKSRCENCGNLLRPGLWDKDHKIPLEDWDGEGHGNRESNLQILCTVCHKPKSSLEATLRAKARKAKSVLFFPKKQTKWPMKGWRKMNGDVVFNPAYWNRGKRGGRNT